MIKLKLNFSHDQKALQHEQAIQSALTVIYLNYSRVTNANALSLGNARACLLAVTRPSRFMKVGVLITDLMHLCIVH
jgi:hypothetical protein